MLQINDLRLMETAPATDWTLAKQLFRGSLTCACILGMTCEWRVILLIQPSAMYCASSSAVHGT
ncbi:hypothetical protein FDU21_19210 [Xanthomonas oryzae pv. oryzae]|nr:hypothetical protein FDU21_19210 [Xanthomonas oryzae pv. oryzae]